MEESTGPRWHVIVGVLGIVYGIAGTLLYSCGVFFSVFPDAISGMFGIKSLPMPAPIRFANLAQSAVLFGAGVLLAVGSMMLVGRRPRGATLVKAWVVIRLSMLVVGLVIALTFFQANIDYQIANMEFQQQQQPPDQAARAAQFQPSRETMEKFGLYLLAAFTAIPAAFPLFVGILLSSKKKKEDIERWRALQP